MRKIHVWVLTSLLILWGMGSPGVQGGEKSRPKECTKFVPKPAKDEPIRDELLDLDLSKNIQEYSEDLQKDLLRDPTKTPRSVKDVQEDILRLNRYVDSLRWMSKEDRKDVKQEGLICILERAREGQPTSVRFAVRHPIPGILGRQKVRSLDGMEHGVSDPRNEYPDDVVIWVLELPFDERSEYRGELARMEEKTPKRLGDLIAYTARTKAFEKATIGYKKKREELLSAQEGFINSFEYRYPRATRHALEALHLEQNTLSHRVRYHFRENWKWWLTAIGVAFVAYLAWRFGRGSDPNMVNTEPHSPPPTSRPLVTNDPAEVQWQAYLRFRSAEASRHNGGGVPSRW